MICKTPQARKTVTHLMAKLDLLITEARQHTSHGHCLPPTMPRIPNMASLLFQPSQVLPGFARIKFMLALPEMPWTGTNHLSG